MRKFVSILLVILMLSTLCVCVFADTDPIVSPTAPQEWLVEFVDYGQGEPPSISNDQVPDGETVRYEVDPNSPYSFIHFQIQGDYVLVEGSLNGPYIVVRPHSDLVIQAIYEDVPVTTSPSDTSDDGPQTGFDPLWLTIAFVVLAACAVAVIFVVKRMAKREH